MASMMQTFSMLELDRAGPVATVTLNRPELHNAFNPTMIAELTVCFQGLASDPMVRVVVLTGAGRSFCAGADIQWMRESLEFSSAENLADAERLAAMYDAVDGLPKPLIGRINGAALGGGAGLVACCDLAIAPEGVRFGFTEVKLGILPAVVGRFVIPKIGVSHARALFVSGMRFDAARAAALGLAHEVVPEDALDEAVARAVAEMLTSAPGAATSAKALVKELTTLPPEQRRAYTVAAIAEARMSPEGQAGLRAFLDKSAPPWSAE